MFLSSVIFDCFHYFILHKTITKHITLFGFNYTIAQYCCVFQFLPTTAINVEPCITPFVIVTITSPPIRSPTLARYTAAVIA